MGKVWGPTRYREHFDHAVSAHQRRCAESPVKEGLLYVGTDDGLVQVTRGRRRELAQDRQRSRACPDHDVVSDLFASRHDPETVYAASTTSSAATSSRTCLQSTNRGRTWTRSRTATCPSGIASGASSRIHATATCCSRERSLACSSRSTAATGWVRVPEPRRFRSVIWKFRSAKWDLVCGTFGRGIFVLDDYSPLRHLTEDARLKEGFLAPVRRTWGIAKLPFGADRQRVHCPESTRRALVTYHLRADSKAKIVVKVADADGKTVREITALATAGMHRMNWDLRPAGRRRRPVRRPRRGDGEARRKYTVTLAKVEGKEVTLLDEPRIVEIVPLVSTSATALP